MNAREELNFGGPNFDIEDYSFVNFAAEYEVNPSCRSSAGSQSDKRTLRRGFRFSLLWARPYGGLKVRF